MTTSYRWCIPPRKGESQSTPTYQPLLTLGFSLSYSEVGSLDQGLDEDLRPRDRSDMKKRMKRFRQRIRQWRDSSSYYLAHSTIDSRGRDRSEIDHDRLHTHVSSHHSNSTYPLLRHLTPSATEGDDFDNSLGLALSSSLPTRAEDTDEAGRKRRSSSFSTITSQDDWPASSHLMVSEANARGRMGSNMGSSQSTISSPNAFDQMEDGPDDRHALQRGLTGLPSLGGDPLRQTLSDDYSDGYVEDVHLLLDNLSCASSLDSPRGCLPNPNDTWYGGPWQTFNEWRALPFEGALLPSDFLHVDEHRQTYKTCLEGYEAHDDRTCLCVAYNNSLKDLWVTPSGISPKAKIMLEALVMTPEGVDDYDEFGNTLIHFLAARGSSQNLSQALKVAKSISRLNSGDQTFLHCLGPSWFGSELQSLHRLVGYLSTRDFNFHQQDMYGQTVFHMWTRRLDTPETLFLPSSTLSTCVLKRDAFGYKPSMIQRVKDGFYLTVPSLERPSVSPLEVLSK